jgi:hypothetical protein
VHVELDISRGNTFYSIVVDWLYVLVDSVSNFLGSNLCARLSFLGLLLSCLWMLELFRQLVPAVLVLYLLYLFIPVPVCGPKKCYQSTSSMVRWCSTIVWCGFNLNTNMANPIIPFVFGIKKFYGKQNFALWQGSVRDALVLQGLNDTLSSTKPTEMKDDK